MVTNDYGFSEDLIVETKVIDRDKHGFVRQTVKDADIQGDDVVFFDYDGTVLHSYKADAFLKMSSMPKNPEHDGLISRGWNWSYEDAQAYVQKYGKLNIGQMYAPADGKTHIKIHIPEDGCPNFKLCFTQTVADGVIVDWGDGSETDTSDVVDGPVHMEHTYTKLGRDYEITLNAVDGCEIGYGYNGPDNLSETLSDNWRSLFNRASDARITCGDIYVTDLIISDSVENITWGAFDSCTHLQSIIFPNSIKHIGVHACYCCRDLQAVIIPNSVESIGSASFFSTLKIQVISIPKSITHIEKNAFWSVDMIWPLIIPDSVTNIEQYGFRSPTKIQLLIIPDSVTNIGNQAFENCYMLRKCIVNRIIPPILGTNVFKDIPTYARILVPTESVDAYKAASGWSTYADQIFAMDI